MNSPYQYTPQPNAPHLEVLRCITLNYINHSAFTTHTGSFIFFQDNHAASPPVGVISAYLFRHNPTFALYTLPALPSMTNVTVSVHTGRYPYTDEGQRKYRFLVCIESSVRDYLAYIVRTQLPNEPEPSQIPTFKLTVSWTSDGCDTIGLPSIGATVTNVRRGVNAAFDRYGREAYIPESGIEFGFPVIEVEDGEKMIGSVGMEGLY